VRLPDEVTERLGRFARLPIVRFGAPGAFLELIEGDAAKLVLLPAKEVPPDAKEGDEVSVFVHLDSEDRPIATTKAPLLELGEVGFLRVSAVNRNGAFVDWGLPKELFVPAAEQTGPLAVGDRTAIGVVLDRTGRLGGTMRVSEMLKRRAGFTVGEWVSGEAWRSDPTLGWFVIVERRTVGLIPAAEPARLRRGDAVDVRIAKVQPDGKLELSLRAPAHEAQADDAATVLRILRERGPKAAPLGDKSDPEELRQVFGLSKKAFKRAVGKLLKDGAVDVESDGAVRVRPAREGGAPRRRHPSPR
jgi:predicted RNA-binding protein (virulence factor B family)